MQKICYRCASQVEEGAAFCPSCSAPQIRVPAPAGNNPALELPAGPLGEAVSGVYVPTVRAEGIQWAVFSRTALPLAALTGFIAAMFLPAVLIAFPLSFRRALSQYRRLYPQGLSSRQGVRLGAVMALLSFVAFLVFFLPMIVVGHDSLIGRIREMAAQYADPQAQQMALWFTTPSGFVVLSGVVLAFTLFLMLLVGLLCGALMTGKSSDS